MKLSTAGNLEALGRIGIFYAKADICIQFTVKTVTKMAGSDIFSFLTCKGTVVYKEVHGNGRLGNLLERNCLRVFSAAESITDMDIGNTGNRNDGTDGGFFHLNLV